jgi:4-methyl-5(b-hydroxyethyl)-thiazole monophosphate biosynthesis
MARVLVPLAEGFEEIEAVTVIDLLRRAGIEVTVAGLAGRDVRGSHEITVQADATLDDAGGEFDMIVLPGGMPGAVNLRGDPRIIDRLRRMAADGRYVAAICAAPSVLAHAGVLDGKDATSFPGFLDARNAPRTRLSEAAVVVDGQIVTSRGAGTAMDFGLALIELLLGHEARHQVESRLQRPR